MDGVSGAAAIGGLVSLADTVITRVVKYLVAVKKADKEISQLLDETSSVSGLFSWVKKTIEEAPGDVDAADLKIMQHVTRCNVILEKLNSGLQPFSKDSGKASHTPVDSTRTGSKKKTKWSWPFSKEQTAEMITKLQRSKTDVTIALSTDEWIKARNSLNHQKQIAGDLNNIRTLVTRNLSLVEAKDSAKHTKTILNWLSTHDPSESHQNAQEDHQEGTGEWIFEQKEYEEWIKSSSAGLWLFGIAGAGKTILASVIIERLFKTVPSGIAYHYCSYKDSISQEPRNVLGSLCRQLVLQNLDLLKDLNEFYMKHHPEGLPPKLLREEDLTTFLRKISQNFSGVTVIIDGLDECGAAEGIDRSKLVWILSQLHSDKASHLRLLVASRPESDIRQAFDGNFSSIPIAARSADLRVYIRAEVTKRASKLRFRTVEFRDEVTETLVAKAEGMFQWVRCQLDDLERLPNDSERQKALGRLPKDLPATYIRIFERIDRDYLSQTTVLVKKALKWLVLKKQGYGGDLPLLALAQAISLSNPSPESFDFKKVPHEMNLVEWCSSLVSLNKKGDILELSHFTVEEFLREDPANVSSIVARSYLVNPDVDALYMAETCLSYLSCQDFDQSNFILNPKHFTEFQNLYPFYCHAAVHLPDYLLALKSEPSNTPVLSRFFSRENPEMFQFWSQFSASFGLAHLEDADMASWYFKGRGLTLIQAAAGFLLVSMTKELLQHGYNADEDGGDKASALHLCIGDPISSGELSWNQPYSPTRDTERLYVNPEDKESRQKEIAAMLVAAGADVNKMSEWGYRVGKRSRVSLTPIGVAIYYLKPDLCRMLAAHGATILPTPESFGEDFKTLDDVINEVLIVSDSKSPSNQIVDFLLATDCCKDYLWKQLRGDRDENDDSDDEKLAPEVKEQQAMGRALVLAASIGNLTAVRMALEEGADINYQEDEETALMAATKDGLAGIVTELLQRGANIDMPCKGGDSPLTWLVRNSGLKESRKLFRDPGLVLTNERKVDALRRACRSQNSELLEFITSEDLEVPKDASPLNLSENETIEIEFIRAADEKGLLSENDKRICFLAAVGSGKDATVDFFMDSTNLAILRSFQPLPAVDELDNSPASAYAVLAKKGFFPLDQIPRLMQHAKDEKLKGLEKVLFTLGVPMSHMDDDGNFPIHRACALQDPPLIQYCLDAGADPNQHNLLEDTPLHILVSLDGSTAQMVQLLVSRGADVNLPNGKGDSPLGLLMKRASWDGEHIKEDCEILLAAGADPNYQRAKDKRTALHLAVRLQRHTIALSKLVKAGGDVKLLDDRRKTPIREAIDGANLSAIEYFLYDFDAEAVIRTPDTSGQFALHGAAMLDSTEPCRILLAAGADVAPVDNSGQTALHLACFKNNNKNVTMLLAAGAEFAPADNTGSTALHIAAQCEGLFNLKELLSAGADVSVKDNLGNTPLIQAARVGRTKNLEILLENGANLNDSNLMGSTALHLAASGSYASATIFLLGKGASINAVDSASMTPLDSATYSQSSGLRKTCARFLRFKGAKTGAEISQGTGVSHEPFAPNSSAAPLVNHLLFSTGTNPNFQHLKELGVNITARNWNGQTVVHTAVLFGCLDSVNYLVEQGLDAHAPDYSDTLPLHIACIMSKLDIVQRLMQLEKSPDSLKTVSTVYGTPLATAASVNNTKLVEMLLDAEADVNEGSHPWLGPPLFVAIAHGHQDVVSLFLSRGAKQSSESCRFKTAKEVAVHCGRLEILGLLED